MRRARERLVISLFVTIASTSTTTTGCLIDRGNLPVASRRDGGPLDAPEETDAGDAGAECLPEETRCDEACVDLSRDPDHCGDCAIACSEGQACVDSRCEGCTTTVYGVCAPSLRVWLDARDPSGDGSMPAAGSPLARWVNRARDGAGDALPVLGAATLEDGAGGRRVVRLAGTRFETTEVVSEDATHAEIFLVARTRALEAGVSLSLEGLAPLVVQLPGEKRFVFGLPSGEQEMAGPFGRDDRQTTLWHAFGGPSGREVRIDGTVVLRGEGGAVASLAGRLSIGGDAVGNTQAIDVSELLVFDAPLSNPDRSAITAALLERWGLGTPATPSADALSLWLDAREPLRDSDPADGASLVRWDDRSPRATTATTSSVTWRANGLGAGQPAVELTREGAESSVTFPRPVSGDFTALVVLATEDGTGEGEGWNSPTILGADGRFTVDDAALALSSGRVGLGREATPLVASGARIDDGDPHLLIVRRTSDGHTQVWVDHERATDHATLVGGVTGPATWALGRGADAGEGAFAARYGEVLVYTRALDDEELSTAERYLARRWATPPAARQAPLGPCSSGSLPACPVRAISELRSAPTGVYWMDLGGGPHRVAVDAAEGGGWLLVLQYVHRGGTDPALDILGVGEDWPLPSPTALGGEDGIRSARWGHVGRSAATLVTAAAEMRFEGRSSSHARLLHFATNVGLAGWRSGTNGFATLPTSFFPLTGHTGILPADARAFPPPLGPDHVLTWFSFYGPTADWAIGAGGRWEVDDLPLGPANSTIHRVWVR
jgi:hypothetical protein